MINTMDMINCEYIHKEDIAILMVEQQGDSTYATHINQRCCKLLHINLPVTYPILIEDIFSTHELKQLYNVFSQLTDIYMVYRCVHRIQYINDTLPFLIRIISLCDKSHKRFLCYCREIKSGNRSPIPMFDNEINRQFYDINFDGLFTIQLDRDDNILLLDYNKQFADYFGIECHKYMYCDIHSLVSPGIEEFFLSNVHTVLSNGSAHTSLFHYECIDEDDKYFYSTNISAFHVIISFIPLQQTEDKNKVLCCAKNISYEITSQNETHVLLEEYNALFHNTVNATSILSCKNPYIPDIIRINPAMQELMKRFPEIQSTPPFEFTPWLELLATQKTTEGELTIEKGSIIYHFKIILVPIIRNHHLERVIMSIIDTTNQVNQSILDSVHLTPREDEVIQHVIMGEKNEYIAQQLCVSIGTVKRTLSNAYSKLGIASRVELFNLYHSSIHKTEP